MRIYIPCLTFAITSGGWSYYGTTHAGGVVLVVLYITRIYIPPLTIKLYGITNISHWKIAQGHPFT